MTSILFRTAALAALLGLSASTLRAQEVPEDPVLFGLSETGTVSVNGATVAAYGTNGDYVARSAEDVLAVLFPGGVYFAGTGDVVVPDPATLWSSLCGDGADRYALRRDGRLKKNDAGAGRLPWEGTGNWLDMAVRDGVTYALRSDGVFAVDGVVAATFPSQGFPFRRVIQDGVHSYSMRSDGTVFRDDELTPYFRFVGGIGDRGKSDGQSVPTTWIGLARDPSAAFVYALRADGVVFRGSLSIDGPFPLAGELVATLPYDRLAPGLVGQVYVDLEFVAGGTWVGLTGNGRAFGPTDPLVPLADFAGDAEDANRVFVDLTSLDGHWYALRSDGRTYRDGGDTHFLDLGSNAYGSIAFGRGAPFLAEPTTKEPKVTVLTTKTVVGNPLRVPVVVADSDTPLASIVVTPVDPVPAGSVWDGTTNTLVWDAPGPAGSYDFSFDVTDGTTTRTFRHTIQLRDPDAAGANKAPIVLRVEKAVAVVGQAFTLPIIVDDQDGDVLTVTADLTAYPFTAGATFDDVTRVFSWTPTFADQGAVDVTFKVRDGTAKKLVTLPMKIKPSLNFPVPEPPPPPAAK